MLVEFLTLLTFALPGAALVHAANVRGFVVAPLGFIVGILFYTAVGAVQIFAQAPTYPVVTMIATWVLALTLWTLSSYTRLSEIRWGLLAALAASLAVFATFWREAGYVGWHSDSYRYALTAGAIGVDQFEFLPRSQLQKRALAYALTQAPATLNGEFYLRSFAPTLGMATAWVLGWMTHRALAPLRPGHAVETISALTSSHWHRVIVSLAVVLLIVSNNRFLWNSLYVNGHLLFAACLLVHSGSGWLRVHGRLNAAAGMTFQSLSLLGIVLVRPEGALVALLAALPFAVSEKLGKLERIVPLLAFAAGTAAWNIYMAVEHSALVKTAKGMLGLATLSFLGAALFSWHKAQPLLKYVLTIVEATLWLALLGFVVSNSDTLLKSLEALRLNIALDRASWGSSILVLVGLLIAVLCLTRLPDRRLLSFPLTAFVPLAFLMAYLRGAPYRDGDRDSLTRMLIHFVPLAAFLLGVSFLARWRRTRALSLEG